MTNYVYLKCVKENRKLRVKIITPGYNNNANCQFPRAIRVEGRKFKVPSSAITVAGSEGRGFFYRVNKSNIKIVEDKVVIPDKIYSTPECVICLEDDSAEMVIIPCGHLAMCKECSKEITDTCPMCRGKIQSKIHKDQLR
jgi:hypothetical protein